MAISINEQYPGKTAGVSTAYPYGKARNVTTPSDGTGTPWEAAIVNDDQGFKQALLQAAGITPSGVPDSATASQYLDALKSLIRSILNSRSWATFTSASRNFNTTYTNNTLLPIMVAVSLPDTISNNPIATVTVNGLSILQTAYDSGASFGASVVSFEVNAGETYRVDVTGATITPSKWAELR